MRARSHPAPPVHVCAVRLVRRVACRSLHAFALPHSPWWASIKYCCGPWWATADEIIDRLHAQARPKLGAAGDRHPGGEQQRVSGVGGEAASSMED